MRPIHKLLSLLILLLTLPGVLLADPPRRDDSGGYAFFEAEYRWREIEDIGEPLINLRDNDFQGPFDIGFNFPFMGRIYNQYWISSNGFIGFGPTDGYQSALPQDFPDDEPPNNIIALFWKDLNPQMFWGRGSIYRANWNGNLIIEYKRIAELNENGRAPDNCITMQVILEPDGDIIMQYAEVGQAFNRNVGSIGIEGIGGQQGLSLRFANQGVQIEAGCAYLISTHGSGRFLIWDAGLITTSGDEQASALRELGYTVTHYKLRLNQQLPADLRDYEAVFVNLGNFGVDGQNYHRLTENEGRILDDYLQIGGNLYLEGGDTWARDNVTPVHRRFSITGLADGGPLSPPVIGVNGTFTEGMVFDEYNAQDNRFVDHLRAEGNARALFTFTHQGQQIVGMVGYNAELYHTIGCSFEFGGLVDGERGTKLELMERIIEFFRSPPPAFPPPLNLRATAGDREVTLTWDAPRPGFNNNQQRILEIRNTINLLSDSRTGRKPDEITRQRLYQLRRELITLEEEGDLIPQRDEMIGYRIFVNDAPYDFTNSRTYTVIELENGRAYTFAVRAEYRNPDGVSALAGPIVAIPTASITPGYATDFEQFNGGLTPQPAQRGWEWGVPEMGAASGQRAWGTLLSQPPYPNLAEFYLYLPTIDLRQVRNAYLKFNHYYNCEGGWDGGRLEISLDNGQRWEPLIPIGGYPDAAIFALNENAGYSGSSGGWCPAIFSLSNYVGQRILVRFVFKSDESNFQRYLGWYIDDVQLPQLGGLTVNVRNADNAVAIEGAQVSLSGQFTATTNNNGQALFPEVPVGRYNLRVTKTGYLHFQREIDIAANPNNVVNVELEVYNSQLRVNQQVFEEQLNFGEQLQRQITLTNNGQRETRYQVYLDFNVDQRNFLNDNSGIESEEQPTRDAPWDLLQTIDLTATTGEQYFYGAVMYDNDSPIDYQYIASAGSFGSDTCRLYYFNREGVMVRRVSLAGIQGWGLRDLAYDGTWLYGSYSQRLSRYNPANGAFNLDIVQSLPLQIARAIAYNPADSTFWIGDRDDVWYKLDRNGQILDSYAQHGLIGVMGMAWNPSDPDGMNLYIHHQETENGGAAIYRFNPRTRQLVRQLTTAQPDEGYPAGAFITYLWDTQTWVLGVVIQQPNRDILKIYELWPRRTWLSVSPRSGQLAPGANTVLTLQFNASYFLQGIRQAEIEIYDMMRGEAIIVTTVLETRGGPAVIQGLVRGDREADWSGTILTLNNQALYNRVNVEGSFRVENIFPGRYRLRADLAGFSPFISDSFNLAADQVREFDIQLRHLPYGYIEGTVRSVYDTVLAGVEVSAIGADGRTVGIDTTDANGFYSILLPQGVYRVVTRLTGWSANPIQNVQVRDNERTRVNIVMDDRLAVRSLRTDGQFDDRILLTWLPAGTDGDNVILRHDDGPAANAIYMPNRWDIVATRFVPPNECDILGFTVRIDREWPDRWADAIYLDVFAEDPNTGLPGDSLTSILVNQHLGNNLEWVNVPARNLRFISRPFFVGFRQIPDPRWLEDYEAVCLDGRLDYPNEHFLRLSGNWIRFNNLPGDLMIQANIWSYSDQNERQLAPERTLRQVHNNNYDENHQNITANSLVLKNVNPINNGYLINSNNYNDLIDTHPLVFTDELPPRRDPPTMYRISINGEIVEDNVQETQWTHFVGSDNENRDWTYRVIAVYDDGTEIPSPEIVSRANLPPNKIRNLQIAVNGLNYTLTWSPPLTNIDGSNCVDYNGCEVFIDGQLIANVQAPTTRYEGRLQDGQDGWHRIRLIAYDEVPNRSAPLDTTIAIGVLVIHNFETPAQGGYIPFLSSSPVGRWAVSASLGNLNQGTGPGRANSGTRAIGTRPGNGRYDDNADWIATTVNEYHIVSPSARLEFYHFYAFEASHDGGQLQISVDNGPWTLLTPVGGYPDQTVGAFGNEPAWTGANGTWQLVTVDLSPYNGHGIKLRWRMKSDEAINWYCGWYLDDIIIWGANQAVYAQVYGYVRDIRGGFVNNANISTTRGSAISAQNGFYRLQNLLPGLISFTASKAGYRSDEQRLNINAQDSVRLDFDLSRPIINIEPDSVSFVLGGNDRVETSFTITNEDELSLNYRLRITPPGGWHDDAQRAMRRVNTNTIPLRDRPWDIVFDYNLTNTIGLSRVMGAEFVNGNFFITANDPVRGAVIGVISEDGRLIRTVAQPLPRLVGWGLRDLASDGQLIYGSQDSMIIAFNLNGNLVGTQRGAPLTVNRALAYDSEADGFWATEWDQPWYLVNRQGQVQFRWDRHGLTGVYGLAYYPEDLDGFYLWALNLEANGETGIYRADPRNGRLELVRRLAGPPTGAFMTCTWDFSRWIFGAVIGSNPQRLVGYEIEPRIAWLTVSPLEGEIDAQDEQEFNLTIAVPPEARQGDRYTADIAIWVENSAQAVLPVRLEIVEGYRHFNAPAVSNDYMIITIEQALVNNTPLPVGSEIAAITPQGVVGGIVRWLQRSTDLIAYVGRGAFDNWSPIRFLVWDCRLNREYEARVEFIQGGPFIQAGERCVVILTSEPPLELTIRLNRGWNLVSSYVRPVNLDIQEILSGVYQRQHLILVKDGVGRFWAPAWRFSNLGPWNPIGGYQINVSEVDSFTVIGERIPANQAIPLISGWNTVAYLLDCPVETQVALNNILGDIIIVKNGLGQFAVPSMNYYGMQRMEPTQGYKIKARRDVQLVYNPGNFTANLEPTVKSDTYHSTGSDMSLLITSIPYNLPKESYVTVFAGENLNTPIGYGLCNSVPIGITLFGDDITTPIKDGATNGEKLTVKINNEKASYPVNYRIISGEMKWEEDGLTIIELLEPTHNPEQFIIKSIYPNPFNSNLTIQFGLEKESWVQIRVLDMQGRVLFNRNYENLSAGWYEPSLDASSWASGIYMLIISNNENTYRYKIVLMH